MYDAIILLTRIAAAVFGGSLIFIALFLYENEEGKLQNRLELWWCQIRDLHAGALSREAAFLTIVVRSTSAILDRIFGRRLLGPTAIAASVAFSFAAVMLVGGVAAATVPDMDETISTGALTFAVGLCLAGVGTLGLVIKRESIKILWMIVVVVAALASATYTFATWYQYRAILTLVSSHFDGFPDENSNATDDSGETQSSSGVYHSEDPPEFANPSEPPDSLDPIDPLESPDPLSPNSLESPGPSESPDPLASADSPEPEESLLLEEPIPSELQPSVPTPPAAKEPPELLLSTYAYRGLGLALGAVALAICCNLIFIAVTRLALSRVVASQTFAKIFVVVVAITAAGTLVVLGPIYCARRTPTEWHGTGMMLSAIGISNALNGVVGSLWLMVAALMLLHRAIWPVIERPIYALHRHSVFTQHRKWVVLTGVAFIGAAFPAIGSLLTRLIHAVTG